MLRKKVGKEQNPVPKQTIQQATLAAKKQEVTQESERVAQLLAAKARERQRQNEIKSRIATQVTGMSRIRVIEYRGLLEQSIGQMQRWRTMQFDDWRRAITSYPNGNFKAGGYV